MLKKYNYKKEEFECQTNGVISDSIIQNWTPAAIDCYRINSDCTKCPINKAKYSFKCQMKHVVKALLKSNGKPDLNNDIVA